MVDSIIVFFAVCCLILVVTTGLKHLSGSVGLFRGIKLLRNHPSVYLPELRMNVRGCKKSLFYKGLTGHEFFTDRDMREALETIMRDGGKKDLLAVFSDPASPSYDNDGGRSSTRELLTRKHATALGFIQGINSRLHPAGINVTYLSERVNLLNIVMIDNRLAYIFVRNFDRIEGVGNQFVLRLAMTQCKPQFAKAIERLVRYYVESSTLGSRVPISDAS